VFKKIALERLGEMVSALMEKGPLFAPVQGEKAADFQRIEDPAAVTLDFYNTALSPKFVFFPQSEEMIRYRIGKEATEAQVVAIAAPPAVLFGVRPCDARSFEIMDRHFLGAGVIDPYWQERRNSTTVVSYAFDPAVPPDPADFYNALGIGAADETGSDVMMVRSEGMLLFKGVTHKGDALLSGMALFESASGADEAAYAEAVRKGTDLKTRFMEIDDAAVAAKLVAIFEKKAFWEETAAACLSCGVCTFVCPTCYCFDIADETLFKEGARKRFWDACMFSDFTLEASGHNPRTKVFQRYRQKVCHKYSYHVAKYGCISCVGCGRCTRACPVNIDIFSVVKEAMNP
jgi:sulfhydrogenase subunit beta (sulfur reductase)